MKPHQQVSLILYYVVFLLILGAIIIHNQDMEGLPHIITLIVFLCILLLYINRGDINYYIVRRRLKGKESKKYTSWNELLAKPDVKMGSDTPLDAEQHNEVLRQQEISKNRDHSPKIDF